MLQTAVSESCAAAVKAATRSLHEEAEAVMMPLIRAATGPVPYAALLQGMYGFYQPLEEWLDHFAVTAALPGGPRHRFRCLEQDLKVLDAPLPASRPAQLPLLANDMDALGAHYVLEGASLGGRIIARMLGTQAELPAQAFRFFGGAEGDTGTRWTRFVQFLNQQAQEPHQVQQVAAAAADTFAQYTLWMKTL